MRTFKTGRRAATHTLRTMRRALALAPFLDALGAPPAVSTNYAAAVFKQVGTWGMYMNGPDPNAPAGVPTSGLGDCVCADSCHQLMQHSANVGTIVVPTDQDCLALYEAVGGYVVGNEATDQGCDESLMCDYLMAKGLCGQTSAGTGMVDPTNLDHIRWCVQLFGACRLGIVVDDAMEDQFSAGQPWTTPAQANDPDAGGHDVPVLGYDAEYAYVCTWDDAPADGMGAKLQPVPWSLVAQAAFVQEAHAEVWADWVAAGGTAPSGFDLPGLLAKLKEIEE